MKRSTAILAEFTIPADTFPLGSIFTEFPDVTVELERIVPTRQAIIPYFWVKGSSPGEEARIESAFEHHPDVTSITLVDAVDDEYLLRVDWKVEYRGVMKAIAETDVVITSGRGSANRWTFEVRSDDRNGIAEFQQYCRTREIPVTITAFQALPSRKDGAKYDLTDPQLEALVLAYERGYFASPRQATLEEVAADLGISRQSLASRLRRGHQRLIRSTLVTP